MESINRSYEITKIKHLVYGVLLALVFCWPWIFIGGVGKGDLVDVLSLGMIPVILISGVIVYKETKTHPSTYRWGFALTLATTFLLVWIIPSVGIFGRSGNPADLIYFGVLGIGVIGALIARFRPRGMAITLFAMAIGQMLVEINGLFSGWGSRVILNGFFAALWIGSALLFWHAARGQANASKND